MRSKDVQPIKARDWRLVTDGGRVILRKDLQSAKAQVLMYLSLSGNSMFAKERQFAKAALSIILNDFDTLILSKNIQPMNACRPIAFWGGYMLPIPPIKGTRNNHRLFTYMNAEKWPHSRDNIPYMEQNGSSFV